MGNSIDPEVFAHESQAEVRVNSNYPDWLTGLGSEGGNPLYFYRELVGPKGLHHAKGIRFGTFELGPNTVHPAHEHPAPEIYFVLEGSAMWHVDNASTWVTKGSVIHHRPFAIHGLKTGDEGLRAVWLWWPEGEKPTVLSEPSKLVNPDRDNVKETAKPHR